jgi:hypothetical protein
MKKSLVKRARFEYIAPRKRQAHWWGSRTSNPVQGREGVPGWVRFPCASANFLRVFVELRHGTLKKGVCK